MKKSKTMIQTIILRGTALLSLSGLLSGGPLAAATQTDPISASDRAAIGATVQFPAELPEIRADGKPATLALAKIGQGKTLALFCFSEQCGVTFFYKQRLQRLQKDFGARGVVFVGVRCGKREKPR